MPRVTPDSGGTVNGTLNGSAHAAADSSSTGGVQSATGDFADALSNFTATAENNTAPGMEPEAIETSETEAPKSQADPGSKLGKDFARPVQHRTQGGKFAPTPTPQPRAPVTQRPEVESEQPDPMASFRQTFGLPEGVDAEAAQGEIVEDFRRTVEEARAQIGQRGFEAPETAADFAPAAPRQQPQRPAQAPQTQAPRDYAAIESEYGKVIADTIKAQDDAIAEMRGQFQSAQQQQAQAAQHRAVQTIEGFLSKQEGFAETYGQLGKRNRGQSGALEDLIEDAHIFQQGKARKGVRISDEQALQAAWDAKHARQSQERATTDARKQIEGQVIRRHKGLDVMPGGGGRGGQSGEYGTKAGLENEMDRFLAGRGAR